MNLSKVPDIPEHHRLSRTTLAWITQQNLWNLWVPESFGGVECSLEEGLNTLQTLARHDGSLGWTVTLCAGANFFIGNLQPEYAEKLFNGQPVILGGSGGVFGSASPSNQGYHIQGRWRYATGAPYLTHFTLSAKLTQNGKPVLNQQGGEAVKSFVLPAGQVSVIDDWRTMGLKATATHSFAVQDAYADDIQSFTYDKVYLPQPLYQLDFGVFADLTLWVNYIGMAEHLYAETVESKQLPAREQLKAVIHSANADCQRLAAQCASLKAHNTVFEQSVVRDVHRTACASVAQLNHAIVGLYPYSGIRAASTGSVVNQIFRDYFTATQHHIFTQ
ncbi:MAG: acyl-CoA dehydrogenase [Alteromonadaceae bacterium]|nr:acyl-CoA dehydrogenase [Alteromonadaceae bacterium]